MERFHQFGPQIQLGEIDVHIFEQVDSQTTSWIKHRDAAGQSQYNFKEQLNLEAHIVKYIGFI
jgi:hypothetical protein